MSQDEAEYLEGRAEAEIEMAQRAQDPSVVQVHYELASAYLDRIHGDSPKSAPGIFGESSERSGRAQAVTASSSSSTKAARLRS